jgi:hypothetical protein
VTTWCTRCGLPVVAPPGVVPDRVYDHAHPPDECVRLLRADVAGAIRYIDAAKRAAPDRYRWIGRPLPEIVEEMARDLDRLGRDEETDST